MKIRSSLDLRSVPADDQERIIRDHVAKLEEDDEFSILLDRMETAEIEAVHHLLEAEGMIHLPKTTPEGLYIVEVRRST